jgi:hypothetical protein
MREGILDRVPLSTIVEQDGFNARTKYEGIDDLVQSIEAHGLQQPLACYRLDVGEDDHGFATTFLQSGYRRRRALNVIAEKLGDPDMLVDVSIKIHASHTDAMIPALAVDNTGEPLKNFDVAIRVDHLIKKLGCSQQEISRLTSIPSATVSSLLSCLRNLHPRIIKVWEKAPSPKAEIPLYQLVVWSREAQSDQMDLFEAYVNGEAPLDRRGGVKKNKNGRRLDGRSTTTRTAIRAELDKLHDRLERGGKPIEIARLEGIAKGLRFALGDISKVL